MRITRDALLKFARSTVEQRTRYNRHVVCVYLTGSLLDEEPLLGGAADIDLIFIHDIDPDKPREILPLTDTIHLDIAHLSQTQFLQPRSLRTDAWVGSYLVHGPMLLHENQHWFEYTQAAVFAGFNTPEYRLRRARPLAEDARQIWWNLRTGGENAAPGPAAVQGYLRALEQAANAVACLSGPPLTERRFMLQFPDRAAAVDKPGLAQGLVDLYSAQLLEPDATARLAGRLGRRPHRRRRDRRRPRPAAPGPQTLLPRRYRSPRGRASRSCPVAAAAHLDPGRLHSFAALAGLAVAGPNPSARPRRPRPAPGRPGRLPGRRRRITRPVGRAQRGITFSSPFPLKNNQCLNGNPFATYPAARIGSTRRLRPFPPLAFLRLYMEGPRLWFFHITVDKSLKTVDKRRKLWKNSRKLDSSNGSVRNSYPPYMGGTFGSLPVYFQNKDSIEKFLHSCGRMWISYSKVSESYPHPGWDNFFFLAPICRTAAAARPCISEES